MNKALNIAIILTAYDKATRVINQATADASKRLKDLKKQSQDSMGAGIAMIGAGLAVAAPIKEATDAAIGFEDKMADVAKVMNLTIGSEKFKEMSREAKTLGEYLGRTGQEAAGLMASLAAGGVEETDIAKVGKMAGEMGVAFGMASEEAGKAFVKIRNALGVSFDEAKNIGDVINYLSDTMASEAPEIVNFMASGGSSVAAAFEVAGKDAAAFGSTLISIGKSSSESATIFERFAKGVFKNEDMKEIFDKAGGGAKGFFAVLEEGNKQKDKFAFFKQFGEYGSDIALLASKGDMLKKALADVADETKYASSVTKEFENRNSTTQGTLNKLKASFDVLKINLGSVFLPLISQTAKVTASVVKTVSEWADANPRLAKTIGFVAAAISGVLMVAGAFNVVKGAMLALNVIMAANPITLIMMAIAAVAAVIIANWDDVSAFFVSMWDKVSEALSDAWQWIKNFLLYYTPHGLIYRHWGQISAWFGQLWGRVKQLFASTWEWIKNLLLNFTAPGLIYKHWDGIVAWFTNIWNSVKDTFKAVVDWVKNLAPMMYQAGVDMIMGLWEGIKAMAHKPVEAVSEMADSIKGKFKNLLGIQSPSKVFMEFGKHISGGTSQGVFKGLDGVRQATSAMAGAAIAPTRMAAIPVGGGGAISISYSPVITMSGGMSQNEKTDFMAMLRKHSAEVVRMVQDASDRQSRTRF